MGRIEPTFCKSGDLYFPRRATGGADEYAVSRTPGSADIRAGDGTAVR